MVQYQNNNDTALIVCASHAAFAEEAKLKDVKDIKLPKRIERTIGVNPGSYIATTVQQLLRMNSSGVVTQDDLDGYLRFTKAQNRANALRNLLPLDLDGDGIITRSRDGYYIIEKDIEAYPADIQPTRNIKYLIAKGVALPKGGAGNATGYLEETGECVQGRLCKR